VVLLGIVLALFGIVVVTAVYFQVEKALKIVQTLVG
jgi:hypothetical protein